jgi:hypothetical protein
MWMFMGVMVLSGLLKSVSNLQDLDAEEKLKGPKPGELLIKFLPYFSI